MNLHDTNDEKHFTVRLSENDPPFTIPRLLRHAMEVLKDSANNEPITINELFLDNSDPDSPPCVTCSFWKIEPDQLALQNENIEWRKEYKVADPTQETIYTPSLDKQAELRMLEYRLPQNENQWNGILLVESLADYLEQNRIDTITDLILQNSIDKDAIAHPYIRVYYKA